MTDATNNIQTAICSVLLAIKRLKKADNNAFAKYRYTSVDDFKDALRPLLGEHGLTPNADELACETFEKKGGKDDALHAKFQFSLWLEHTSGEVGKPERLTVMLPYVGAQTSGAARSYAIKEWLKSKFLASSGDSEDPDAHDSEEELSKAEARPHYIELQAELAQAIKGGKEAMDRWAESRRPTLEVLPKDWRLTLRARFKEGLASGKISAVEEEPLEASEDLDRQYIETMREDRPVPTTAPNFDKLERVE